jgi:hypothetical protein
MLLPNVPAAAIHGLVDRAQAYVLQHEPALAEFLLPGVTDGTWANPWIGVAPRSKKSSTLAW